MTTLSTRGQGAIQRTAIPERAVQAAWYIAGAALAFAVPFIFTSVLDTQHDLFYLIYFATVGAFLGAYVKASHADVVGLFRRGWKLSLAVGALTTVFVVFNILQREDATPRPDGAYFGFELVWRGLVYGVVDALLLTAFPVLVTYALFGGKVTGIGRRLGFAAVALVLVMAITATYHLGYQQYREDGLANPEIGNTVISVPALVSTNPLGSVITHAAQHVTAVTHAYETPVFLPPQTDAR
jgi:hypothetical protein